MTLEIKLLKTAIEEKLELYKKLQTKILSAQEISYFEGKIYAYENVLNALNGEDNELVL